MDYPGQEQDDIRRKAGAGLLAHLVDRGTVDAPPEPEEDQVQGPSPMEQLHAAKRQRQQSLASLFTAAMVSSVQAPTDRGNQGPRTGGGDNG